MTTSIPTLSSIGWVKTPAKKADYVLSCFIANNKSDSVLFKTDSLPYTLKQFANQPIELQDELRRILENLMRDAFRGDQVTTEVFVDNTDATKPSELSIRFTCRITVDGVEYNVGKLVESIDSKITAIRNIVN